MTTRYENGQHIGLESRDYHVRVMQDTGLSKTPAAMVAVLRDAKGRALSRVSLSILMAEFLGKEVDVDQLSNIASLARRRWARKAGVKIVSMDGLGFRMEEPKKG